MKFATAFLTFLLCAAACVPALAQPPRSHGGRGGGHGPGGPGDEGVLGMLGHPRIREEIGFTDDQREKLEILISEIPRPKKVHINPGDFSPENRKRIEAQMQERRQYFVNLEKLLRDRIGQILSEEQRTRLDQIVVQRIGIAALMRDSTAEKLNLTDEQRTELKSIMRKTIFERMREVISTGDRDLIHRTMKSAQRELEERMLAVLSDEQKSGFEALKGEPIEGFDFASLSSRWKPFGSHRGSSDKPRRPEWDECQ